VARWKGISTRGWAPIRAYRVVAKLLTAHLRKGRGAYVGETVAGKNTGSDDPKRATVQDTKKKTILCGRLKKLPSFEAQEEKNNNNGGYGDHQRFPASIG